MTIRRDAALLVAILAAACTKARSPDSTAQGSSVASGAAPLADSQSAQQPPQPHARISEPGVGLAVEPAGSYEGPRDPGRDLNNQVGGSGSGAANPERSLVVLKSHRTLDPASGDDSEIVMGFIKSGKPTVKQCYENLRGRERSATGTMTLRFVVTSAGKVTDATVDSWDQELSACVVSAIQHWTLAPAKVPTRVELVLSLVIG